MTSMGQETGQSPEEIRRMAQMQYLLKVQHAHALDNLTDGSRSTSQPDRAILGRPCSGMHFELRASRYSRKNPVSAGYILPESSPHHDPYRTNRSIWKLVEGKGLGEKLFFSIGQINGWAALHMTPPWWGSKRNYKETCKPACLTPILVPPLPP